MGFGGSWDGSFFALGRNGFDLVFFFFPCVINVEILPQPPPLTPLQWGETGGGSPLPSLKE